MSSEIIIHPGVVDHIEGGKVFVRILSQSACSTCHAKSMCNMAEVVEKIVEADYEPALSYKPGDDVMVKLDESLGRKAVMLGYGLPFLVLIISVIIFLSVLKSEGLAALLSILMLVPYYSILYLLRHKIQKEFRFRIE